eukprot:363501-Chlamydomonas_euryale.AAC.7
MWQYVGKTALLHIQPLLTVSKHQQPGCSCCGDSMAAAGVATAWQKLVWRQPGNVPTAGDRLHE